MKNGINRRTIFASELSWNRVCVAVVRYSLYDANFRQRLDYVSFGSVSGTYIHIYICMRGNRRTKNTFVAVESRSLTEFYAWRVPAANPRFPPTTGHSLAASLPTIRPSPTTRKRDPHPGIVVGRSRGSDPSTSSIDGNLTADRKARLPLRSSAKIAMKASRHLESFSSLLIPLVWPFFPFFLLPIPRERKTKEQTRLLGYHFLRLRFR